MVGGLSIAWRLPARTKEVVRARLPRSSRGRQETAPLRQTAVAIVVHAGTMCRASEIPLERIGGLIQELATWVARQPADQLGPSIIGIRKTIDKLEAVGGGATRRFRKAGGYPADGSPGKGPRPRAPRQLAPGPTA